MLQCATCPWLAMIWLAICLRLCPCDHLPLSGQVTVDFEGRCPTHTDYHGIRQLLLPLLPRAHVNWGQLADIIIAQNTVGSVLKVSTMPLLLDAMQKRPNGYHTLIKVGRSFMIFLCFVEDKICY